MESLLPQTMGMGLTGTPHGLMMNRMTNPHFKERLSRLMRLRIIVLVHGRIPIHLMVIKTTTQQRPGAGAMMKLPMSNSLPQKIVQP